MYARPEAEPETVLAAGAGDREAIEELLRSHLPLVYNIAGRALGGHPDVDDVVQETMARVVSGLKDLRDPGSFRSWLVAITMSQVHEWFRTRGTPMRGLDEVAEVRDPAADFVGLTITQLGLSGQRKETAEATRWLDPGDREALSLWWLEVAGALTRSELAAGLGMSEQHAAVRVQRMKGRLETSRAVVRALAAVPRCGRLAAETADWDGVPSPLWRKRISRHVRDCRICSAGEHGLVPAERLLVGLGLVAVPAAVAIVKAAVVKAAVVKTAVVKTAAVKATVFKPVAVVTAGATLVTGGAVIAYTLRPATVPLEAAPRVVVSASPRPSRSLPRKRPGLARVQSPYGTTVDGLDRLPPRDARPAPLPRRPAGTVRLGGKHGYSRYGGDPDITHRGDYITITGKGYFRVRWGILYQYRAGHFQPATWTGLNGKLFHVASGGGRRVDDQLAPGTSLLGSPDKGYVVLPPGQQRMWNNEFYYLDGTVTLHNNERGADYDLVVAPKTWQEVVDDITATPDPAKGLVRYGLSRDTGDDRAPVPQYLTRKEPADPADVPQRSRVTAD